MKKTNSLISSPKPNTNKFLITGNPGIGKTTLIMQFAKYYEQRCKINGFYTREIRQSGVRIGFGITTFQGTEKILAHVNFDSQYRIGRYGVSLSNLNDAIQIIESRTDPPDIWIIDEIGKMESYSSKFKNFIERVFSELPAVIATIAKSAGGWISLIRNRKDLKLLELTYHNREHFFQNFISNNLLEINQKSL